MEGKRSPLHSRSVGPARHGAAWATAGRRPAHPGEVQLGPLFPALRSTPPYPSCSRGFLTPSGPRRAGKEGRRGSQGDVREVHAFWDEPRALWALKERSSHRRPCLRRTPSSLQLSQQGRELPCPGWRLAPPWAMPRLLSPAICSRSRTPSGMAPWMTPRRLFVSRGRQSARWKHLGPPCPWKYRAAAAPPSLCSQSPTPGTADDSDVPGWNQTPFYWVPGIRGHLSGSPRGPPHPFPSRGQGTNNSLTKLHFPPHPPPRFPRGQVSSALCPLTGSAPSLQSLLGLGPTGI